MSRWRDDDEDDATDWERLISASKHINRATTNESRRRWLPTSAYTLIDGSPLRHLLPGERDIDGDRFDVIVDVAAGADRVRGLTQAGHGFRVETLGVAKARLLICPFCDGPLYDPVDGFCELKPVTVPYDVCDIEPGPAYEICEIEPSPAHRCRCNWCLREPWDRGRPRIHCGKPECKRVYDAQRKQRSRNVTKIP